MREWVSIGILATLAAGLIGFIAVRVGKPESALDGASPAPRSARSTTPSIPPSATPNSTPSSFTSLTPSPSSSLNGTVLAVKEDRAASSLDSRVYCSEDEPGKGSADLTWVPATKRGQEQKLQVTIYRNGFDSGDFKLSESLPPGKSSYTWSPQGQAVHQWRVLTRHPDGWIPSETARFEGPSCVGV